MSWNKWNNTPLATDEQIYSYFCGSDVIVNEMYLSILPPNWRKQDTGNSFGLFDCDDGIGRWHDFGLANQRDDGGYTAIDLIKFMRNCDYKTACRIRDTEVANEWMRRPYPGLNKGWKRGDGALPYVQYDARFTDYELRYWDRYKEIGGKELLQEQIYSLKSLRWGNSKEVTTSMPEDPAFIYIFNENPISWKIYRPLNKGGKKFRQWGIENVVEGLHQLRQAETGILVSSTKERIVCKHAFSANLYLNPTGESSYIQLINNWPTIKPYAKRWLIMYDSDEPGYLAGEALSQHLAIQNIDMRNKLEGNKDFSDYIDKYKGNHSYLELKTLIHNLIN